MGKDSGRPAQEGITVRGRHTQVNTVQSRLQREKGRACNLQRKKKTEVKLTSDKEGEPEHQLKK